MTMTFNHITMKQILMTKIMGEVIIKSHGDGFQILRGNGKDVIAFCDTQSEAEELVKELKILEENLL